MQIKLRQLRLFTVVASHGGFSRAAKALHLTPRALSRQVKGLEDELGVALFKRGSHSVSLTHSGQIFFEDARVVLARVDKAIRRVQKPRHR